VSLLLTPNAIDKLEADLQYKRKKPGDAFRLVFDQTDGFEMRLDSACPGDVVLPGNGKPLLVIAPALAELLVDTALDVGRDADEPDWVLVRLSGVGDSRGVDDES
jgi:hypothetical protein